VETRRTRRWGWCGNVSRRSLACIAAGLESVLQLVFRPRPSKRRGALRPARQEVVGTGVDLVPRRETAVNPGSQDAHSKTITAARLTLVAATAALVRAEMDDLPRFFRLLQVQPSPDWPPEDIREALPFFREQLETRPELAGWCSWYWVSPRDPLAHRPACGPARAGRTGDPGVLVGAGGFTGPPVDGIMEIGYHVLASYRRRGYATEAVDALVSWAFRHAGAKAVTADTGVGNTPSRRLLEKLGFTLVGGGAGPGSVRYLLQRPASDCGSLGSAGLAP